jgi:predicted dehydrogenase
VTLRVALIGAGTVADLHAGALTATAGVQLVGVYDANRSVTEKRAAAWDVPPFESRDAMLAEPGIDAVYVLTPAVDHVATATACVQAGKHVLIEKPVATDPEQIRALARAARQHGVHAVPGHNYLHLAEARRLVSDAQSGRLGDIRALFVNYAIAHPESLAAHYGDLIEELFVHHLYLAHAVLGAPSQVTAGRLKPAWTALPTSDQAWITLTYHNGDAADPRPAASAHLFASFAVDDLGVDPQTFAVKALGTQGTSGFSWRASTRRASGDFSVDLPLYEETYLAQTEAFRDVVTGRGREMSTLEDAAAVADVVRAADESATAQRTVTLQSDAAVADQPTVP